MGYDNSEELLKDAKVQATPSFTPGNQSYRYLRIQRIKPFELDQPKMMTSLIFRSSDGNNSIASLRSSININMPLYE